MEVKREINALVANHLSQLIQSANTYVARVGWTEGQRYAEEPYPLVAAIAVLQEFGGQGSKGNRIPSRPFLRLTISAKYVEWLHTMAVGAEHILENGGSFESVLFVVGNHAVDDIRETVANFVPPPLHPLTIALRLARKSKTIQSKTLELPLLDTGFMLATLNNVVEKE